MTTAPLIGLVAGCAYLLGAIPFGYLIGRARGVDVLRQGSGNIGATNVARLLGLRWGILVFVLDFLKGGVPVLVAGQVPAPADAELYPQTLSVVAGVAAFLGHLFPIYLGFRGGKGVATGAGVIAVLVPWTTVAVLATWGLVLWLTRYVSLASIVAAAALFGLRLLTVPTPWSQEHLVITLFCLAGAVLVLVRHQANIRRILAGTEHRLGSSSSSG
ncbi:MAG: glycerol-3-phosphate 1-O-acyltransferase PlsY [Gemmataceae bacterium]